MRILITGCDGQVGCSLLEHLKNNLLDLSNKLDVLATRRSELDITDRAAVFKLVLEFKPDVIINAAAYTAVDKAESDIEACYRVNRDGPSHLAKAAQSIGCSIIHISTDYVFSGDKNGYYVESDSANPNSIYGESKFAGEVEVAKYCEKHIILRTSWVFSEYGNNFLRTMLNLAKSRDVFGVVDDQTGGPTYAGDIASTLVLIAKELYLQNSTAYGVYHYCGEPSQSWHDFAEKIFFEAKEQKLLEKVPELIRLSTKEYPTAAKRPGNSKLNCKKIEDTFRVYPSNWIAALKNIQRYQ